MEKTHEELLEIIQNSYELQVYAAKLGLSDVPPREIMRAVLYAAENGLEGLSGPGCVAFKKPTCGDWDCLRPAHQALRHGASA
jgi:hypothetical protein